MEVVRPFELQSSSSGLSKNFSFWTGSLDLDTMFKIKSLLYKDLILNSRGCRKSNQLLRHPLACNGVAMLKHRFSDRMLVVPNRSEFAASKLTHWLVHGRTSQCSGTDTGCLNVSAGSSKKP